MSKNDPDGQTRGLFDWQPGQLARMVLELETQNEGYAQLLGSANNDVVRLSDYADSLEAKLEAAMAVVGAVRVFKADSWQFDPRHTALRTWGFVLTALAAAQEEQTE